MSTVVAAARTRPGPAGLRGYARTYLHQLRGGEMGALPAILGLVVLVTAFSILKPIFFTPLNFANLLSQGAGATVIALGVISVLLLGEIDLSAGFTSGACACLLGSLLTNHHWPWYAAVVAAVAAGAAIGLTIGLLVAKLRVPSFVVTLAAFLALQGVALFLVGGHSVAIVSRPIAAINYDGTLPPALGWVLYVLVVGCYAATQVLRHRTRAARGLVSDPIAIITIRIAAPATVFGAAVYVLNLERGRGALMSIQGIPNVVLIIAALLAVWTFVLNHTRYGRHVYAVGGNREAARRAGINVDRIRGSAFVICSAMAAVGGILLASHDMSVDANTGGSNTLLYAVGAAVIGGTSLFGGKGRYRDAILGGAVVAVIANGMNLMGYGPAVEYVVTGGVLLVAAGVDAVSCRRAVAVGPH